MDRRSEAIGGWGALALGVLTLVGAGAEIGFILAIRAHRPPATMHGPALVLAAVTLLQGVGLLAAVRGMRFALRPPGQVVWAASWIGWTGAAALVLGGLLGGYGLFTAPRAIDRLLPALGMAAAALTAVWAVTTCAAAWKVKRLPVWVRIAGVVFGVLTIVNIVLPLLRALTLLSALAWWFGLGAALLSLSRMPEPDPAAAID